MPVPQGTTIGTWLFGTEALIGTPPAFVVTPPVEPPPLPLLEQAINELNAATTRVVRRVDIYEQDGTTLWMEDVPTIDGTINVDGSRDERRTLDVTFSNEDDALDHSTDGFWYDKIIKPFRGVELQDGSTYLWPMGVFMIDKISAPHFPGIVKVSGRDYTKKLVEDEFQVATAFVSGTPIEQVISTILINGGITRYVLPGTNLTLDKDFLFDSATSRWAAISEILIAYGYEGYFNAEGIFVMRPFQDPAGRSSVFTFRADTLSNLAGFEKSATSTNLYNAICVRSQSSDPNTLPVFGIAENHDPRSPASIENLGRKRTLFWDSPLVTMEWQAVAIAQRLLTIAATDTFVVNLTALVFPFLEAMEVVDFLDPDPAPDEPSRFLLTDFSLPLGLGTMTANAKRITLIT